MLAKGQNFECPDWVTRAGKCEYFKIVIEAAWRYSEVLESEYEIVDVKFKNKIVYLVIERGSIRGLIRLGKFDNVKNVRYQADELIFEYDEKHFPLKEKLKWSIPSGIGGILIGLLLGLGM